MKTNIAFIVIITSGILLRFWGLTDVPPSLSHDETAIAYNAYSILKTGKDEYGTPFPLLFRSFDDYKLPGMVYSTVPFVALFGKSELAARLPSAIYGSLSIIVMYFLMLELTTLSVLGFPLSVTVSRLSVTGSKNRKQKTGQRETENHKPKTENQIAALLCAAFFAFQPWHINFSRQLFESNGAVFWFMLASLFLVKSIKKPSFLIAAAAGYAIALYFYYSVRLVIPFILLAYAWHHRRLLWTNRRTTVIAAFTGFALFFPIGREMLTPGGMERISIVSVANDPSYHKLRDAFIGKIMEHPTPLNRILYNRRVALALTVLDNYRKNISPRNLFVSGTGTYGALYPFETLLVPLGLWALLALPPFPRAFILTWLVCGFFPGAFSINQPNTLRTLVAAPALAIVSGLGITRLLMPAKNIRPRHIRFPFTALIALTACIAFAVQFPKFLYAYFVDNPTHNAVAFGDGHKQMTEYVVAHEDGYDRVVISGYYWRPYIFLLYWKDTDPVAYQQSGTRDGFGKYIFTAAPWDTSGVNLAGLAGGPARLESGKTLFIVSNAEYESLRTDFTALDRIDGAVAQNVFVSATLQ